jgi:hypothetical protein
MPEVLPMRCTGEGAGEGACADEGAGEGIGEGDEEGTNEGGAEGASEVCAVGVCRATGGITIEGTSSRNV